MNTIDGIREDMSQEMSELSSEELSATELDTVSGGWSIRIGDIVDAAKWVYHHTVGK